MSAPKVDVLLPVAEIRQDCIINLRKQPDGSRWPVGTKLYAIDGAAVAELIRASRRAERLLRDIADAGFGDPSQADELRAALANIGPQS